MKKKKMKKKDLAFISFALRNKQQQNPKNRACDI